MTVVDQSPKRYIIRAMEVSSGTGYWELSTPQREDIKRALYLGWRWMAERKLTMNVNCALEMPRRDWESIVLSLELSCYYKLLPGRDSCLYHDIQGGMTPHELYGIPLRIDDSLDCPRLIAPTDTAEPLIVEFQDCIHWHPL